jgi:hypothetical protein
MLPGNEYHGVTGKSFCQKMHVPPGGCKDHRSGESLKTHFLSGLEKFCNDYQLVSGRMCRAIFVINIQL